MKIYIASDHAGFELKKALVEHLKTKGFEVEDCGAHEFDPDDDYPDFISKAAEAVSKDQKSRGIIIGASGQGEAMVANKFKNVRAVVFYGSVKPLGAVDIKGRMSDDPFELVRLSRAHNDANVLSLGARFLTEDQAKQAVDAWLATDFEGGRHARRVEKIAKIEENV